MMRGKGRIYCSIVKANPRNVFIREYFVIQMIPNSCATHALVSILLNCPELQLGKDSSYLWYNTLPYVSLYHCLGSRHFAESGSVFTNPDPVRIRIRLMFKIFYDNEKKISYITFLNLCKALQRTFKLRIWIGTKHCLEMYVPFDFLVYHMFRFFSPRLFPQPPSPPTHFLISPRMPLNLIVRTSFWPLLDWFVTPPFGPPSRSALQTSFVPFWMVISLILIFWLAVCTNILSYNWCLEPILSAVGPSFLTLLIGAQLSPLFWLAVSLVRWHAVQLEEPRCRNEPGEQGARHR